MRSALDCIPCFIRQTLDAARAVSNDPAFHESILRDMLLWIGEADLTHSPPRFAQHIHRRLRAAVADDDPYREAKQRQNEMALRLAPQLRETIASAPHPLDVALRVAVAGNAIDMGVPGQMSEPGLLRAIEEALDRPLAGRPEELLTALGSAERILYLADNAGEIAFDLLLIERLGPRRVTVAVRGKPVLNDATLADAHVVGLDRLVEVIGNGSDAPGTVLDDCSEAFRQRFVDADLIIAKGQGNFESLSEEDGEIYFLFKVKCQVIADRVGLPMGSHVVTRASSPPIVPEEQ